MPYGCGDLVVGFVSARPSDVGLNRDGQLVLIERTQFIGRIPRAYIRVAGVVIPVDTHHFSRLPDTGFPGIRGEHLADQMRRGDATYAVAFLELVHNSPFTGGSSPWHEW